MKKLNNGKLKPIQYNVLTDYFSSHPLQNEFGNDVEFDELYIEERTGDIYALIFWKTTSECNDSTGHNIVSEDSDFRYAFYLSNAKVNKIIAIDIQANLHYHIQDHFIKPL